MSTAPVSTQRAEISELARLHKALSDETRLRIVAVLSELGELCVCDLEAGLEVTQSKASRHLGVLRHAGLVSVRREGTWVHYRIADDLDDTREALIAAVRAAAATPEGERDISRTRERRRRC